MSFRLNSYVRWSCLNRVLRLIVPLDRVLLNGLGHVAVPALRVPEKLERRKIRRILVQGRIGNSCAGNVSRFVVGQSESSRTQIEKQNLQKVNNPMISLFLSDPNDVTL